MRKHVSNRTSLLVIITALAGIVSGVSAGQNDVFCVQSLFPTPHRASVVRVFDSKAYVGIRETGEFLIVDVSDPTNPTQTGVIPLAEPGWPTVPRDIDITGSIIGIASRSAGMQIYDAARPYRPVSRIHATYPSDVHVIGTTFYYTSNDVFNIYDVSTLSEPVQIGEWSDSGSSNGSPREFRIVGTNAFIVHSLLGLLSFDITDPTTPQLLDSHFTQGISTHDLEIDGNVAFVSVEGGIDVLDISDPANMVQIGTYPLPYDEGNGIELSESNLFTFNSEWLVADELRLFDVSDPTAPILVDENTVLPTIRGMAVKDSVVYLTIDDGLLIINRVDTDDCVACPENVVGLYPAQVDIFDLLEVLRNWGTNGRGSNIAEPINVVDVMDLLALLAAWGDC